MRCEDYPCCGHGPAPLGDGGGCPDAEGRFDCCGCGAKLPAGSRSALCDGCHRRHRREDSYDEPGTDERDMEGPDDPHHRRRARAALEDQGW